MKKSQTKKRCEGCGRYSQGATWVDGIRPEPTYGWTRPQGKNCQHCDADRETGRAAIAELAKFQARDGETLWRWVERDYAWPTYRAIHSGCGSDPMADALSDAMWKLVAELTRPAPEGAPQYSDLYEMRRRTGFDRPGRGKVREYLRWPLIIASDADWSRHDWGTLVLCRPSVRERLVAVDAGIRASLDVAWQDGKDLGASVLLSLASGSLSMDDFDETLERRRDR